MPGMHYIHDHYECDTLANKLMLKKQYFQTEMKEGTSVEAHMKHMKEPTDKLVFAAIGAPIPEEDKVVILIIVGKLIFYLKVTLL